MFSYSQEKGEKFLHLSFLGPSINYNNDFVRQLIHEFHNFFVRLRTFEKVSNGNSLNANDLQGISRQYQSVIRSVCLKLRENLNDLEDETLFKSLKEIELIWSLVDVLLLRSADSLPSQDLVEWSKWNFSELNSLNDNLDLNANEKYFCTIYTYLLLGRIDEARNFLLQHPRKNDPVFVNVEELLAKFPSLNDKNEWLLWQNLCQQRLAGKHFLAYPELEIIVKILCGDNETYKHLLTDLNLTWYQIFVGKLLFSTPFVKIYELSDIATECLKWQSRDNVALALDNILITIFDLDLMKMLKLSSDYFHNSWFVAHLTDLLYFAGSIDLGSMKESIDLRERLLMDYANSLMNHRSLWQLSIDYFSSCPSYGKHCLQLHLERLSCDSSVSGRKVLKILEICRKYEFYDTSRSIAKEQCVKALKENDLNKSLSWCLQTKDSGLASYLVQKFLQLHGRSGLLHSLYLLDNLGEAALLCPSLTFLGKYREFCNLRKSENFHEAASLLCHLIVSRVAPLQFWSIVLEDMLPLLQMCKEKSLLTSSEIYSLMNFVEDVDNERCHMKNSNLYVDLEKDSENLKLLLFDLRLALVKNLGRATVVRS